MPRKPRPLNRDEGVVRDARLVVIASEDRYAVKNYFDRFRPKRVQFRVLPTEDGDSSPNSILQRLEEFCEEYQIGPGDELWYCGDVDHWAESNHISTLTSVMAKCRQKGYFVALSNPCFELWLLLHFSDLPSGIEKCKQVTEKLKELANGYSKRSGCVTPLSKEMIEHALRRSKAIDTGTPDIPNSATTRVYMMLETLLDRESIRL